eukprot:gene4628-4531_t
MHLPPDLPTPLPLERWLNRLGALVMPLALLVVLLLFLQWPLRDGWGAGSSQANDVAQVLFALYVAVALRHADRRGAHLVSRPDLAHAGRGPVRAMRLLGAPLAVLPWAVFVCINAAPTVWRSVRGLESFPETANPGYFAIKLALLLLAVLLALQALADLWRASHPMNAIGLLLLVLALVLMMTTGWATYAVLLGVSTLGAVAGLALGAFDGAVLRSLPERVVGLLEHDLLQALVLYAVVGALLNHLALVNGLYSGLRKLLTRVVGQRAAPDMAGLGVGMLMAPMNGSVGASLVTLSHTAGQAWAHEGMPPARRTALVAVASTLGIIVPPSLVLLLLGDAMLRAHTEGLTLATQLGLASAHAGTRIINTQDVLQAALAPGALLLVLWMGVTWWLAQRRTGRIADQEAASSAPVPLTRGERWTLGVVPTLIVALLALVTTGRVRAVEAAATAGVLLLVWGVASRQLTLRRLAQVLDDAMALTGALFALLVAAVTFSLVLRAYGTDALVAEWMRALQGQPLLAMGVVLAVLLGSAFVLDAFELIFLIIPIVMPPLLALVDDAAWVAALTLLVLQAGFLLPPLGYALVLSRAQVAPRPAMGAVARALAPYLLCLAGVIVLVMAVPATTQWLRSTPATLPEMSIQGDDLNALMREMSQPEAPAPAPAASPMAP